MPDWGWLTLVQVGLLKTRDCPCEMQLWQQENCAAFLEVSSAVGWKRRREAFLGNLCNILIVESEQSPRDWVPPPSQGAHEVACGSCLESLGKSDAWHLMKLSFRLQDQVSILRFLMASLLKCVQCWKGIIQSFLCIASRLGFAWNFCLWEMFKFNPINRFDSGIISEPLI